MLDQHDRHRVGAGELLRAAARAIALPAALGELRRAAALRAEAVPRVPVEQAARAAVERQLVGRQHGERGESLAAGVGGIWIAFGRYRGEQRLSLEQAEEDDLRAVGLAQPSPLQPLVVAQPRDQPFEPQQPGLGMRQLGQSRGVGADWVRAVERVSGEGERGWAHALPSRPGMSARIAAGNSSSSG